MRLNTKTRRLLFDIFSIVFWLSVYIIAKIVRFHWDENPGLVSVLIAALIVHVLIYQVRLSKLKRKRQVIKASNIEKLKKELKLSLKVNDLPGDLVSLKDIVEKWGVGNNLLRDDLYSNATHDEVWELKQEIETKLEAIEIYLEEGSNTPEHKAIFNTFKAYNDLGLWTWEKEDKNR